MSTYSVISNELKALANKEKALVLQRFFKTGKGEYGEGDFFIGITVPQQRAIVKKYFNAATENAITKLMYSKFHEERLSGVLILVEKFKRSTTPEEQKKWMIFYTTHINQVNNWDLVDSSAHLILGKWLEDKNKKILYDYAKDPSLWKNRVAIVATLHFIRNHDFNDLFKLSKMMLSHPHDLIHKATGWMLREAWKKDKKPVEEFLQGHYRLMPRTMLRYAIEKMPENKRLLYLKK